MTCSRRFRDVAVLLIAIAGCSAPRDGFRVTSDEYGEAWPFTVDAGTVRCVNPRGVIADVIFEGDNGRTYALNGIARGTGKWLDFQTTIRRLRNDQTFGPMAVPLPNDWISRALESCH